jgi:hypothetical protein
MKQTTFQLLVGFIAGFAIAWFFFHNCNKAKPCPDIPIVSVRTDTGHIKDVQSTDWYRPDITFIDGGKIPSFSTDFYKPVAFKPSKKDSAAFSTDFDFTKDASVSDDSDLQAQTTFNFYRDHVKTKYGTITIEDTLRNNQISARRVSTDFDIPIVTKTVVVNAKPKPKVYWAMTAIGDQDSYVTAAGGGLILQFRNKRAIEANAIYQFKNLFPGQRPLQYQLTLINPFSKK